MQDALDPATELMNKIISGKKRNIFLQKKLFKSVEILAGNTRKKREAVFTPDSGEEEEKAGQLLKGGLLGAANNRSV